MKAMLLCASCIALLCSANNSRNAADSHPAITRETSIVTRSAPGSWPYFLQHLPVRQGMVVDYRGRAIRHQGKAAAIIDYDIGSKDLQQCADALMRLRAEYLFQAGRSHDIRFLFTSGQTYAFEDYCKGIRPVLSRNNARFERTTASAAPTHTTLRKYLDIVYTFAGTISLGKQLQQTGHITIGTVILKPGSPGHCCIVIDEKLFSNGERRYKLAEGFMPAQSIYVLRNEENGTVWHRIQPGKPLYTASYDFTTYGLYAFE